MKILLFDMDGVLLHPRGYHRALMETVRLIGVALGFRHPRLTQQMIDTLEAQGITSEWESAAICTALMLRAVWRVYPDMRLPDKLPLPNTPAHDLPMPDLLAFLETFACDRGEGSSVQRAERLILSNWENSTSQEHIIRSLLEGAHLMQGSLTHRIFQELALGERLFEQAYGMEPFFHREGMLFTQDRPALTAPDTARLRAWIEETDHRAAVFTNRPSQAPKGFSDTPEAEIGLKVVDLADLPVIGHGGLTWLSNRLGLSYGVLLKPSPVHILAALQRALGAPQEAALLRAAELSCEGSTEGGWRALDRARVCVFEDAAKGIHSARGASTRLAEIGVEIRLRAYGVTTSPPKAQALEKAGARLFPSLQGALMDAGVLATNRFGRPHGS
jgi:hypothetical protein